MDPWMTGGWYTGWIGMIFMILFWGLIIALLIGVVRWLFQGAGRNRALYGGNANDPMEVLKARYARGEITREEFKTIRTDLLQK